MVATQLQDHLKRAHNIIKHASLLKPNKTKYDFQTCKEQDDEDDDNDND